MERIIFSVLFFMMLGVPFYLLYKIARDIFGTAGAGEPAQLPQGKQKRSGGSGSGSIWQGHLLQGSSQLNPHGGDCNGDNSKLVAVMVAMEEVTVAVTDSLNFYLLR